MTVDIFAAWLKAAPIGDKFVYHQTPRTLSADRTGWTDHDGKHPPVEGLDDLATAVMQAEGAAQVALFQQRRAEGGFSYIAVRVSREIRYRDRPRFRRAA